MDGRIQTIYIAAAKSHRFKEKWLVTLPFSLCFAKMPVLRRSSRLASSDDHNPLIVRHSVSTSSKDTKKGDQTVNMLSRPFMNNALAVGDEMPRITLTDLNDEQVDLYAQAKSHKYVVIFAYPKAATPGCTRQLKGFESNFAFFSSNNVLVYGLSADSPKAQSSFAAKYGAEFPLLSDPNRKLITELGASKSPKGVIRSHWIFVDGKLAVRKSPVSPEVSVDSARQEIEDFVKKEAKKGGANNGDDKVKKEGANNGDDNVKKEGATNDDDKVNEDDADDATDDATDAVDAKADSKESVPVETDSL